MTLAIILQFLLYDGIVHFTLQDIFEAKQGKGVAILIIILQSTLSNAVLLIFLFLLRKVICKFVQIAQNISRVKVIEEAQNDT